VRDNTAESGQQKKVTRMQGFGGLDNCSLCGVEVEEGGERMRSIDDITYVFCSKCARTRREEINRMLKLNGD
jgi:hypothetical protein